MADYWAENLRLASIQGIEVDLASRRITGGHSFGRHQFQGQSGQDTEPTGANPLAMSLSIELDASVNEAHYPGTYTQLVNVLLDPDIGGRIDYVDPVFGPIPMQVVAWTSAEDGRRRNAAVIELSLEQRTAEDLSLTTPIAAPRGGASANAMARTIDMAMPSRGVLDEDIAYAFLASGYPLSGDEIGFPVGGVFAGMTEATILRFETTFATVDFVRGEIDRFRARCAAMEAAPQLQHPEAVDARMQLMMLADFVAMAGYESIARLGIEAMYEPVGSVHTAHSVADRVYGDASRWQDVVAANGQIRNPLRITTTRGPLRVFVPRRARSEA